MIVLKVIRTNKTQRISKDIIELLRERGVYGRIKFMRREVVNCPKESKEISPINCLICKYFKRRVKGEIHCSYLNKEVLG